MVKPVSFGEKDTKVTLDSISFNICDLGIKIKSGGSTKLLVQESLSFKHWLPDEINIERTVPFKNQDLNDNKLDAISELDLEMCVPNLGSPGPMSELDAAALKLQKVYKSYRTRRTLADCAVIIEELWWKARDFASLRRSSISFFNGEKPESAISRWERARTRAAKVGKGLSKSDKAQKLALQHWLEAIDPRHRYGHNLRFYYNVWFKSESTQPFFYWLDIGDGKELNLDKCPRNVLQHQCVIYLGPVEREAYEVILENGKLVYKQSRKLVDTVEGSKWIFILSTLRTMYVGQKRKGRFHHSSFLAGGATIAAGRLVAKEGILKAVWSHSGHYLPTEENFKEFIRFLQDNSVDLTNIKTCSIDDDEFPLPKKSSNAWPKVTKAAEDPIRTEAGDFCETETDESPRASAKSVFEMDNNMNEVISIDSGKQPSCKWTTGTGPRIGCVRDYPTDLQCQALEQVNLSPTEETPPVGNKGPIPSPRPGLGLRLSPVLSNMGFPNSTVTLTLPKPKMK